MTAENATAHHRGRRLTGFTFGTRGAPVYARVYDKTEEASSDAPVRQVWASSGHTVYPDEQVWRVEFEVRGQLLRELMVDGHRLPVDDPSAILSQHLPEVWTYVTRHWLVLRDSDGVGDDQRLERRPPSAWWSAVARGGERTFGSRTDHPSLRRRPPPARDVSALLRQARGLLVTASAVNGTYSISEAIGALESYVRGTLGDEGFSSAVRDRETT